MRLLNTPLLFALSTDKTMESEPVVQSERAVQSKPVVGNESIVETELEVEPKHERMEDEHACHQKRV